jgi:hypothetical protein
MVLRALHVPYPPPSAGPCPTSCPPSWASLLLFNEAVFGLAETCPVLWCFSCQERNWCGVREAGERLMALRVCLLESRSRALELCFGALVQRLERESASFPGPPASPRSRLQAPSRLPANFNLHFHIVGCTRLMFSQIIDYSSGLLVSYNAFQDFFAQIDPCASAHVPLPKPMAPRGHRLQNMPVNSQLDQ